MDDNSIKDAFEELLDSLELLDTRTEAILQLLKDSGITTDENFIPYLEKSDTPSDIRVRAARARIDYLFSASKEAKPTTEVKDSGEEPSKTSSESTARQDKRTAKPERSGQDAA